MRDPLAEKIRFGSGQDEEESIRVVANFISLRALSGL